jgi:hypothetical protein
MYTETDEAAVTEYRRHYTVHMYSIHTDYNIYRWDSHSRISAPMYVKCIDYCIYCTDEAYVLGYSHHAHIFILYNLQTTAYTDTAPRSAPLYVQSTGYIIYRWGFYTRISHCYTVYRLQYIQVRLPYPKVKTIILTMITVYTDEAPVPEYPLFCSLRTTVSTDEAVVPKHLHTPFYWLLQI